LTSTRDVAIPKAGDPYPVAVRYTDKQSSSINSSFRTNISGLSNPSPRPFERDKQRSFSGVPFLVGSGAVDKSTLSSLTHSTDSFKFAESPNAEQIIFQQTLHLKNLEQQIKEL
jgi:hypothetical protein